MTYYDYLNAFYPFLDVHPLSSQAQLLFMHLLAIHNRAFWPDSVHVSNATLMRRMSIGSDKTLRSATNELKAAGMISKRPGCRGRESEYHLLTDWCAVLPSNSDKSCADLPTNSVGCKADVPTNSTDCTAKVPSLQDSFQDLSQEEDFASFWERYPNQVAKPKAHEAYLEAIKKVPPSVILETLEQHRAQKKWDQCDVKYIPYPANWLRSDPWNDVLPTQPNAAIVPLDEHIPDRGW